MFAQRPAGVHDGCGAGLGKKHRRRETAGWGRVGEGGAAPGGGGQPQPGQHGRVKQGNHQEQHGDGVPQQVFGTPGGGAQQDGQRYMHVEDMQEEKEDCVFAGRHRVGGWGQGRPEYMLKQYLMY